jgi:hypothetical protein
MAAKTSTAPLRGLENDGEDVPAASRRTAAQKLTHLELMIGMQVANYCPVIARNTIVKNSTSIYEGNLASNSYIMAFSPPGHIFSILITFV